MGTYSEMKEPYMATLREDWKSLTEFYKKNNDRLLLPITFSKDTALHMAVYSEDEKLLKDLLDLPTPVGHEHPVNMKNIYGNTPLHAAVSTGNIEAVKLLVEESKKILVDEPEHMKAKIILTKNKRGETPLFLAAAFGQTEMVKYLKQQTASDELLYHWERDNFESILHVAVRGKYFETALLLLKIDGKLSEFEDREGRTCLHLLADMPSAFKSRYSMGIFSRYLYMCLPFEDECDDETINGEDTSRAREDMESGQKRNMNSRFSYNFHRVLKGINGSICRFFFKGWPLVERIWENKRKHKFALQVAKMLIRSGGSWDQEITLHGWFGVYIQPPPVYGPAPIQGQEEGEEGFSSYPPHPLFTATKTGILEIVYEILREHPQAIEFLNRKGQNILHVAVMYRQEKIFNLLKSSRILLTRMSSKIDNNDYTLLHQVADNKYCSRVSKPGPALQLQEELEWFRRVKKVIPHYYVKHRDYQHGMTAEELFEKKHNKQLREAQQWTKETAQSCSAVAALISTIVFAAAYTVPGGSNEKGIPVFLHNKYFLFFTIMDVISLASSLTSLVMFLSILTSPFHYEDFHYSIPRKLILGFTLLFFSVATTMLAFAATILLIINSEKQLTAGLISIAAFVPVSVFALMQFRLYVAFLGSMKSVLKETRKSLPWFCAPFLLSQEKPASRFLSETVTSKSDYCFGF